ncbi:MAG: hypothetical protein QOJ57_2224 [Thermoleophilaceae bacterium]|jgi:hypothetical protein|nr:hypothetical protein [Thermoleophilaceae bacterium]
MRAASLAGILVAASFAATGCGAGSSGSPTILDTEKVERAIEQSSLAQRGEHARVSCPSGVHQEKGKTFSCTATIASGSTQFTVTQPDGSGRVHYAAR